VRLGWESGGLIAADGGAKDSNGLFLNPYGSPSMEEEYWFNFCQSSTRTLLL